MGLFALLVVLVVVQSAAKTLLVAEGGSGSSCSRSAPCALDAAIELAVAGDAVLLAPGFYEGVLFPISLNKSISLVGSQQGAVLLDGGQRTGLLELFNASIMLQNLTLANGFAPLGGAVYVSNCSVIIQSCLFVNNTAVATLPNAGGGAVYLNNSAVAVADCEFVNSNGTMLGGALASMFDRKLSPGIEAGQLLSVRRSRFVGNNLRSPRGAQGAAVGVLFDAVTLNNTVLVFESNEFVANKGVGESGDTFGAVGVLYVMNTFNNSIVSAKNHFAKNNASVTQGNCYGGGLSVQYLKLSTNVSVYSVADVFESNTCLAGQQGNAEGGALSVMLNEDAVDALVSIQGTQMSRNFAHGHYSGLGGGVSVFNNGATTDFVLEEGKNVYFNNSARSGGEGSGLGGGISMFFNNRAVGARVTIEGSHFYNNSIVTEDSQEGSCLGGGASVFFNSQVSGVSAQMRHVTAQFNKAIEDGNEGKSYGGGLSIFFNENQHDNPGASIENCNVTGNIAMVCPNVFAEFACI